MSVPLELEEDQWRRLEELAGRLRVDPTELAKAAINDLISRPPDDFNRAIEYVLAKNRELYRRLAQ
jgi:predicted transcriptional regulator